MYSERLPMSRILDADTVAAMLGSSARTVDDHARAGVLPGTKFGEGWVFVDELVVDAVRRKSIAVVGYRLRVDFGHADLLIRGRHRPGVAVLSDIIRVAVSLARQFLIASAAVSE